MMPVTQIKDSRNLKAAIRYAEKFGFAVFPVFEPIPGDKTPLECTCPKHSKTRDPKTKLCTNAGKHPRTARGFLDASRDLVQIKAWWREFPTASVGVAVDPSGIFLLDIDPRNEGDEGLNDLIQAHQPLPDTPIVLTGGGGRHIWFKRPEIPQGFKFKPLIAPGVEVKCQQGYVVVPPSLHAAGRTYDWELSAHLDDIPLAPPPQWVVQLALTPIAQESQSSSTANAAEGMIGRAFIEAGWWIRDLLPDRGVVRCPWESEHTSGVRGDSSTVVFAPRAGRTLGYFHCSHAHCANRSLDDVLKALPEAAVKKARKHVPPPPPDTGNTTDPKADWCKLLAFSASGAYRRIEGNAALLLANDPEWKGLLQYDELRDVVFFGGPVPAMPGFPSPSPGEILTDAHYQYIQHWLARNRGLDLGHDVIGRAVKVAARAIIVNPLLTYLDSLKWDGIPRVSLWLDQYLHAERTPQAEAMGRMWLVSCVARARRPGCQADHMLVLEGAQGSGKSSAVRILGGEFYRGNLPSLRDTDRACHAIQGGWLIEVGELDALRGAEGTRVKNFLTQTTDHYRSPYAREYVSRPRRCVFIGTTNESTYLQDTTGARRFWPVRVGELDRHGLERDRDQLWAEADHLLKQGATWWPGADLDLSAVHEDRFFHDEWEEAVLSFVASRPHGCGSADIYDYLGIKMSDRDGYTKARLSGVLHRAGYERRAIKLDGAVKREWIKAEK